MGDSKRAGGRPPAEEPTTTIGVRVPVSVYDAFWQKCHGQGLTVSEALRYFVYRMVKPIGKSAVFPETDQ